MKVRIFLFTIFSLSTLCSGANDFNYFCSLVALSPTGSSWCSQCSSPSSAICGNCGVTCSNSKITALTVANKGLTTLPNYIGSLTSLTSL